jgi:hypothetical protein
LVFRSTKDLTFALTIVGVIFLLLGIGLIQTRQLGLLWPLDESDQKKTQDPIRRSGGRPNMRT